MFRNGILRAIISVSLVVQNFNYEVHFVVVKQTLLQIFNYTLILNTSTHGYHRKEHFGWPMYPSSGISKNDSNRSRHTSFYYPFLQCIHFGFKYRRTELIKLARGMLR